MRDVIVITFFFQLYNNDLERFLSHPQAVKTREENDRQALLSGMCSRIKNTSILDEVGLPDFAPILVIVPPSVAQNWEVSRNYHLDRFFYCVYTFICSDQQYCSSNFYRMSLLPGVTST